MLHHKERAQMQARSPTSRRLVAWLAASLTIFACMIAAAPYRANADISSSLVARWALEEGTGTTTADSSGNANTATISTGTSSPLWIAGKSGSWALTLDGYNDYIGFGDVTNSDNVGALTISLWFKAAVANISSAQDIMTKGRSGFQPRWELKRNSSEQFTFFATTTGGTSATALSASFADTNWHHVAAVYNGSTIQMYVDGQPSGSAASLSGTIFDSSRQVCAGRYTGASGLCSEPTSSNLSGSLDEIRIYNRGLSSSDIQELYGYGVAPTISSVASSTTATAATITWSTDIDSSSRVDYGATASYGSASSSASLVASHSITVTGLSPSTAYHFQVSSTEAGGAGASSTDYAFLTQPLIDSTAPAVSSVASSTGTTTATVTWTTDEASMTQVEYGLTSSYTASTTLDSSLTTSHSVTITGLSSNTTYHFRALSTDASDNVGSSTDSTFTTSRGYAALKGIPDPGFGVNEDRPARPTDWSSEAAGYYYVDYDAGTDSGRTYGTPSAPRKTIPNPVPAGSYIEVHGYYRQVSGGVTALQGSGTSGAWVANESGPAWIVGYDSSNEPQFTWPLIAYGSYLYFDTIQTASTSYFQVGSAGTDRPADHIMLRNSDVVGDGLSSKDGITVQGRSTATIDHVVIFNTSVHDFGEMSTTTDQDSAIAIIGAYSSYVWLVDNDLHTATAGVRVGGAYSYELPEYTHHIFVAGNEVYNTKQSGLTIKYASDIVFSENYVHDIVDTEWSPSKGLGAQYGPERAWYIFNRVEDARYGVYVGSTDGGGTWPMYIIGNRIQSIHSISGYAGGPWGEAGIMMAGATHKYVIGNTLYDVDAGINMYDAGSTTVIMNNIVSSTTEPTAAFVDIQGHATNVTIDKNIFYRGAGSDFLWGGSNTAYTLAELQSSFDECASCLTQDPKFASAGTDFSLQAASPAIDAGDPSYIESLASDYQSTFGASILVDLLGVSRPQNGLWDIGAYERTASDATPPVISAIASTTGVTTATITWSTDELATSTVEYGPTASYGTASTSATDTRSHSIALAGLSASTAYHFRVSSQDTAGNVAVSSDKTFSTGAIAAPSVTTSAASSVSTASAALNGSITATGGADATESGFAYGTDAALVAVIGTTTEGAQSGATSLSHSLSSLTCATTYYARAYATNTGGTGYGSIVSFTTSACPVVSSSASNPTNIVSGIGSGPSAYTAPLFAPGYGPGETDVPPRSVSVPQKKPIASAPEARPTVGKAPSSQPPAHATIGPGTSSPPASSSSSGQAPAEEPLAPEVGLAQKPSIIARLVENIGSMFSGIIGRLSCLFKSNRC